MATTSNALFPDCRFWSGIPTFNANAPRVLSRAPDQSGSGLWDGPGELWGMPLEGMSNVELGLDEIL